MFDLFFLGKTLNEFEIEQVLNFCQIDKIDNFPYQQSRFNKFVNPLIAVN
jgi:hypothetical protein